MADNRIQLSGSGNYCLIENGVRKYYDKNGNSIKESVFLKQENAVIKDGKFTNAITGSVIETIPDEKASAKKQNAAMYKKSAELIVNDLKKAIKGFNDDSAIKAAFSRIKTPEEFKEVERLLAEAGYKGDDMYSAVEKFMYDELGDSSAFDNSFGYMEETVQKWIKNGVLKGDDAINAQARLAARIIRDGGDGAGTDVDELKRGLALIKAPVGKHQVDVGKEKANAKAVLQQVEKIIKNAHNETLTDYLKGEVWDGEVKQMMNILAGNDAIEGDAKAKAVKDLVKEAVSGAGTNVTELKEALTSIKSRGDRLAVEKELEAYCKANNIPVSDDMSSIQAVMYDELDTFAGVSTDHAEVRKFNELLISQGAYNAEEITELRAKQALKQILEGDFDNIQDAIANIKDKDVLNLLEQMLIKNKYKNLDDFLAKNLKSQDKRDIIIADLASRNLVDDQTKVTDAVVRLLKSDDYDTQAMGIKAIRNSKTAQAVDAQLTRQGTSLAKIMDEFNAEKAKNKERAAEWDRGGSFVGELISDEYRENTDMSDNLYIESETAQEIDKESAAAYKAALQVLEGDLIKLKTDYQDALDTQGAVSGAVNLIAASLNVGTTRDEIEARIEHDEETVRLLKLAAEGKLSKMVDGKEVAVTFEEVFKERQSEFISANGASFSAFMNEINPKSETEFSKDKVTKVSKQAEQLMAMETSRETIVDSWSELTQATKSNNNSQINIAVIKTSEDIAKLTSVDPLKEIGLQIVDGKVVDSEGNPVSADNMKDVAEHLKKCLSGAANLIYGKSIPENTDSDDVSEILDEGVEAKKDQFREEYKAAFGQEPTDEMLESYMTTINYGVMAVNVATAIAVTVATAGSGSLAVFAGVAGQSLALNTLEHSTDATGLTSDELTRDVEQSLWDGALGAVGVKVGMYAEKFATSSNTIMNAKQFLSKIPSQQAISKAQSVLSKLPYMQKLGSATIDDVAQIVARLEVGLVEFTSDGLQAAVQQYCMNGEINREELIRSLLMSAGFNLVGHAKEGLFSEGSNIHNDDLVDFIKKDLSDDLGKAKKLFTKGSTTVDAAVKAAVKDVDVDTDVAVPVKENSTTTTMTNGDKLTTIVTTKSDGSIEVDFYMNDKLVTDGKIPATDPSQPKLPIGDDSLLMNLDDGTQVYVEITNQMDGSRSFKVFHDDKPIDLSSNKKASAQSRVELKPLENGRVSQEFNDAMNNLNAKVKAGQGNSVADLIESNPLFAQFKDELSGLENYRIVGIDDATNTQLGQYANRRIALNLDALKNNEDAFVETLLHEAEHAKQHQRYTKITKKSTKARTKVEQDFVDSYKAMEKADKARADYYNANKEVIDKFVSGKALTEAEHNIALEYKKLYDSYAKADLEMDARDAGANAAEKHKQTIGETNGQRQNEGTRGVQENNSTGRQEGALGPDASDKSPSGVKGTEGRAVDNLDTNLPEVCQKAGIKRTQAGSTFELQNINGTKYINEKLNGREIAYHVLNEDDSLRASVFNNGEVNTRINFKDGLPTNKVVTTVKGGNKKVETFDYDPETKAFKSEPTSSHITQQVNTKQDIDSETVRSKYGIKRTQAGSTFELQNINGTKYINEKLNGQEIAYHVLNKDGSLRASVFNNGEVNTRINFKDGLPTNKEVTTKNPDGSKTIETYQYKGGKIDPSTKKVETEQPSTTVVLEPDATTGNTSVEAPKAETDTPAVENKPVEVPQVPADAPSIDSPQGVDGAPLPGKSFDGALNAFDNGDDTLGTFLLAEKLGFPPSEIKNITFEDGLFDVTVGDTTYSYSIGDGKDPILLGKTMITDYGNGLATQQQFALLNDEYVPVNDVQIVSTLDDPINPNGYTYDLSEGTLNEPITLNVLNEHGDKIGTEHFEYDDQGNLSKSIDRDINGRKVAETEYKDKIPVKTTLFDENGNVVNVVEQANTPEVVATNTPTNQGPSIILDPTAVEPNPGLHLFGAGEVEPQPGATFIIDEAPQAGNIQLEIPESAGTPREVISVDEPVVQGADVLETPIVETPAAPDVQTNTPSGNGIIIDPNAVEPRPDFHFIDPNAVEPRPDFHFINPNAVEPNPDLHIINPNAVEPRPDATFIIDEAPQPSNVQLEIPEPTGTPREVINIDEAGDVAPQAQGNPSGAGNGIIIDPNVVEPNPDLHIIDPNAVEPRPDLNIIDPNAVEPRPDLHIIDPNAVEPNPDLHIIDPNAVDPNPDLHIIDPNAVDPNPDFRFVDPVDGKPLGGDDVPVIDGDSNIDADGNNVKPDGDNVNPNGDDNGIKPNGDDDAVIPPVDGDGDNVKPGGDDDGITPDSDDDGVKPDDDDDGITPDNDDDGVKPDDDDDGITPDNDDDGVKPDDDDAKPDGDDDDITLTHDQKILLAKGAAGLIATGVVGALAYDALTDDEESVDATDSSSDNGIVDESGNPVGGGGADGQQAGGADGQQAGSADGQQAGGADGQQAGGADGQQAGGADGQQAGGADGQQAGGADGQQAGGADGQQAGSADGQQAGGADGQQAGGADGKQAGGAVRRQPGGTPQGAPQGNGKSSNRVAGGSSQGNGSKVGGGVPQGNGGKVGGGTPQGDGSKVGGKPQGGKDNAVDGKPEANQTPKKEKREISSTDRLDLVERIKKAKNEDEVNEILKEMRSEYKVFKGRKNLRRALKDKRRQFRNENKVVVENDSFDKKADKYQSKYEKHLQDYDDRIHDRQKGFKKLFGDLF